MSLPRFLTQDVPPAAGGRLALGGAEGRHAAAVRRVRPGEHVEVGDGRGRVATCVVLAARHDGLDCAVERVVDVPPEDPRFVVVQALAKGDRGELSVELMTEIGVDVVVPWAAERSIVRWDGDRAARGLARWRSTAREAAKQAHRAWLPEVRDPVTTDEAAALLAGAARGLVLHEDATDPLVAVTLPATGDVVLVVGPEGGLTPAETGRFTTAGASAVRLGATVLRTSTAGAAAAAVLSAARRWR